MKCSKEEETQIKEIINFMHCPKCGHNGTFSARFLSVELKRKEEENKRLQEVIEEVRKITDRYKDNTISLGMDEISEAVNKLGKENRYG